MIDPPTFRTKSRRPVLRWFGFPLLLVPLALLVLVGVLYAATYRVITIADGAQSRTVRTQETTVEGVLRDADVALHNEDIVNPPLDAIVRRGATITIKRARLVRLLIDDNPPRLVRTQRQNARDLLNDIGAELGGNDALRVNGEFVETLPEALPGPTPAMSRTEAVDSAPDAAVADIEILRAVPVVIQEQGKPTVEIRTIAPTVGEALLQAGSITFLADRVEPGLGTRVAPGMVVTVTRARLVTIWVDGVPVQTRTHAETVAELLSSMKIMLLEDDYTRPELDAAIADGSEVRVVRVTRELQARREPIDFQTYWEPNPELELDSEALAQEGEPGVHELRDRVVFEDGQEVQRQQVVDRVVDDVKHRIFQYGTKIVVRDLPTPSGPVQYWRRIQMFATSYSASTSGVSRSASWYGKTRCGQNMRRGIVAVDPYVIPLGTMVYVEGYGVGLACDTGSAVLGKRIDLGYGDDDLEHWYRSVDVYILTPVPSNPRYRLN